MLLTAGCVLLATLSNDVVVHSLNDYSIYGCHCSVINSSTANYFDETFDALYSYNCYFDFDFQLQVYDNDLFLFKVDTGTMRIDQADYENGNITTLWTGNFSGGSFSMEDLYDNDFGFFNMRKNGNNRIQFRYVFGNDFSRSVTLTADTSSYNFSNTVEFNVTDFDNHIKTNVSFVSESYRQGYLDGKDQGYRVGYNEEYDNGYLKGCQDAKSVDSDLDNIFSNVLSVGVLPVSFIFSCLDFSVWGVNVSTLVSFFFSVCILLILFFKLGKFISKLGINSKGGSDNGKKD